jgi:hypothetical protein
MDSKRARKPNFSSAECALILQLAEENIEIIREKFSSTITNKRKHAVWQNICEKINALGVAKRSATDIKEKWRAMRNEAYYSTLRIILLTVDLSKPAIVSPVTC